MDKLEQNLNNIHTQDNGMLESNHLEEDVQQRILELTMKKIQSEELHEPASKELNHKKGYKPSKKKYIVVALAACLGLSAVICATTINWNNKLARYFNEESSDKQQEAQVVNIDQSDTENGLTISTVQLIGDQNGFSILLKIKGDSTISGMAQFESIAADIEGDADYTIGDLNAVGCEEEGDYYILNVRTPQDLKGKKIKLKFYNYGSYDSDSGEFITTIKGKWSLEWNLDYVNSATTIPVNKEISLYGGTAVFDSVSISPISVAVRFSNCKDFEEHMSDGQKPNDTIIVQMMDGTVINSSYTDASDFIYTDQVIGIYLKQVIRVEDIESITFAGVTVPITKNPNPLKVVDVKYNSMNLSIAIPEPLYEVLKEPQYEEGYDDAFNANTKRLSFVAQKDGIEMPFFTISAIKAGYSQYYIERLNPMCTYLGVAGDYVYVISYGEVQSQEQIDTFADLLNTYVSNISQRITLGLEP